MTIYLVYRVYVDYDEVRTWLIFATADKTRAEQVHHAQYERQDSSDYDFNVIDVEMDTLCTIEMVPIPVFPQDTTSAP